MAGKNLRAGLNQSGESEIITLPLPNKFNEVEQVIDKTPIKQAVEQKIEVEIRDIIRIKPSDFSALKDSFEQWASNWN